MTQSPDDRPAPFPSSTTTATSGEQPPIFGSSDHNSGPAFTRTGPRPKAPNRVVKILACGALVAAAAILSFVILGSDGASRPDGAVRDFFDAAKDKDCDRMLDLVTEASWSQNGTIEKRAAIEQCTASVDASDFGKADITGTKVLDESGDTATVEVTTENGDADPVTETLTVAKEDGRWVLDFSAPVAPATDEPAPEG